MLQSEPCITVGIIDHEKSVSGRFQGEFHLDDGNSMTGSFAASIENGTIALVDAESKRIATGKKLMLRNTGAGTFTLNDVTIGIQFHWERKESQTFQGSLLITGREDGTLAAINIIPVEQYLTSVISSEMSAEAPKELLRAHAITSRSWLVAMLEREKAQRQKGRAAQHGFITTEEIVRWYDREDHDLFDVCADDHCQRYQGITKIISPAASVAVAETRGVFLLAGDQICDARFYKACGGLTENFENSWEPTPISYLSVVADSPVAHQPVVTEQEAERWILSSPDAYCNTTDGKILKQVLPSFDQETTDFFRWTVTYKREELETILRKKSGIDFGTLSDLIPLKRGPSGRIYRLKIVGTKRTMIVGKELEIRKWLSNSHLYSGAFIVQIERDREGVPTRIVLRGAGWGHGVGLCQIGAAVMAAKGFTAEEIVSHYFRGTVIEKLY